MKSKKTISEKEFLKLSKTEQTKELKQLTKRANVRLSQLEEKDPINLAYTQAYQYNLEQDRDKNRFAEKTNYKTDEIKQTFKAVSNFLNNKSSTLKGVQENTGDIINNMVKSGNIDESVIAKMTTQEQKYASKYIAQASNKKLSDLEKADIKQYAYAMAKYYNKADGRKNNRFYRGTKFTNEEKLQTNLENMIHFFNSKTSTEKGYKETILNRLDHFRERGVYIPTDKEYEFFQFLGSEEFKKMRGRADSNQVIENYLEARNEGKDVEEINDAFKEFLDTDMTFDQMEEKLGNTKRRFKKPVIYL